jgi:sphingomyelin phosphodiesterase 2
MPTEINVITLNCWGLKFISKFHNERLLEIGKHIANANPVPQIVGLQECWTQKDYQAIRKETKHILPFGKFYHSGIFGGGLAILSKWPIEESSMFRYPLNGRPTAFFRGDWYVGKGVACARIRFGPGVKDIAEVFTTHVSDVSPQQCPNPNHRSFTPHMRQNPTTPIFAIVLLKPGKLPSSCAERQNAAILS